MEYYLISLLVVAVLSWAAARFLIDSCEWRERALNAEARLKEVDRIVREAQDAEQARLERQEMEGTLWPC